MPLFFGETLKRLRGERDLTQEALAGYLGVTFQTVSKWERGETYPDITLLPALASFFGVSADTLLGLDRERNERRIESLLARYDDTPLREKAALLGEYERAVRDFPGDFRLLVRYMELLCAEKDGVRQPDYEETDRAIASIWERIRERCTDDRLRIRAKRLMIGHLMKKYDCLYDEQSRERALELLREMPALADGREYLAMEIGAEPGENAATELLYLLQNTLLRIVIYAGNVPASAKIEAIEAVNRLILIAEPNAPFGKNGMHLIYNYGRLGYLYQETGDEAAALLWLRRAADAAVRFDARPDAAGIVARYYENEPRFREMDMRARMAELMTRHYPLSAPFKASPAFREILALLEGSGAPF